MRSKSKTYKLIPLLIFALITISAEAQYSDSKYAVPDKAEFKVKPFHLSQVVLLDGPFKEAMDLNARYLLQLEPDRLLYWHYKVAGLTPKKAHYGGWENMGSIALGHYLSACSFQYAATGDKRFEKRVQYIVDELERCQRSGKDGALFGWENHIACFDRAAKGDIEYKLMGPEFPFMNGNNPWYTIHKDMAGLRDAYIYCHAEKAKEILTKFADWAISFSQKLDNETFQETLDVEHGGMSEILADVFAITGEPKYLDLAQQFIHQRMTGPISQGHDILWPHHANAQIPKFVGYQRIYELQGDLSIKTHEVSKQFYRMVLENHTLANGGNSEFERFGPPGQISKRIGTSASETCNTYNMLKLSAQLYKCSATSAYMDYYEHALYNHILASQDPLLGSFTYYVSLKPGHFKTYSKPFDSFWCCVGSGMENHTKYGENIYAQSDDAVYVNLFIASKLEWKEKKFSIQQDTRFPYSNTVRLKILQAGGQNVSLKIRYPDWVKESIKVMVNNSPVQYDKEQEGYISLTNKWKKGDVIQITMPMSLHLNRTPDNPHIAAIQYGPILLSAGLGKEGIENVSPYQNEAWDIYAKYKMRDVPFLIGDTENLDSWIKPVNKKDLNFSLISKPDEDTLTLIPFYKMHHQRYAVYWDIFSPQQWNTRREKIKSNIHDEVIIGDSVSEHAHGLRGEGMIAGQNFLRDYRGSNSNGWFSYDLSVKSSREPVFLSLKFWGGGWGADPEGKLEVIVDGKLIAIHDLGNKDHPTLFYDLHFPIPQHFIEGKTSVRVYFRFNGKKVTGGIYGCRLSNSKGLLIKELLTEQ